MKKTLFTYIMIFFFCILFILGSVSTFIYSTAFDVEKYMKKMDDNGYEDSVLHALYRQLDGIGDVISVDADDVYELLDKNSVVEHSKDYTRKYLLAILKGEEFSEENLGIYSIEYAREDLKKLVMKFYETSSNEFSEEEFQIIYDYLQTQINSALRFVSTNVLGKTVPYGRYALKVKEIAGILRFSLVVSLVLLMGIVFLNLKKGAGSILYKVGGTVFVPSAILFIPTVLFDRYNLGSKVALDASPLSVVFSSVLDTLIKGFELFSGIFFFVSLALIIVGAALKVIKLNSAKSDEKPQSDYSEEQEVTNENN